MASREEMVLVEKKQDKTLPIILQFEAELFDTLSLIEITSKLGSVASVQYADQINPSLHGIREDQDTEKRSLAKMILYNKENIEAVFFSMPNGDMYIVEPFRRQLDLSTPNFSFRDWYLGVTATQSTYVSELFDPQGKDDNSIAIVAPVKSETGQMVGIWGALLRLDALAKKFDSIDLNKNEHILLIDHNGNLVVDSQQKSYKTMRSFLYLDSVNMALNHGSGTMYEKLNGMGMFTIFSPVTVGTHTWALIITEPQDEMFATVQAIRIYYILLTTALLTAALLLWFFKLRMPASNGAWLSNQIPQIEDDTGLVHLKLAGSNYKKIIYSAAIIVPVLALMFFVLPAVMQGQEHVPLLTYFVIENLRGDTVDTWMSWKVPNDGVFHIHVARSPELTDHRMNTIYDVVYSTETLVIDDSVLHKGPEGSASTYYKGWYGAIKSVSDVETRFPIPIHFHSTMTDSEDGHIVIRLSSLQHGDGYAGYTKLFVDEQNRQILKATITVYDVDRLDDERLAAIVRHELGHGFGLAHSTDPDDLMYPEIKTPYPYISECVINALVSLYDGMAKGQIVCEK